MAAIDLNWGSSDQPEWYAEDYGSEAEQFAVESALEWFAERDEYDCDSPLHDMPPRSAFLLTKGWGHWRLVTEDDVDLDDGVNRIFEFTKNFVRGSFAVTRAQYIPWLQEHQNYRIEQELKCRIAAALTRLRFGPDIIITRDDSYYTSFVRFDFPRPEKLEVESFTEERVFHRFDQGVGFYYPETARVSMMQGAIPYWNAWYKDKKHDPEIRRVEHETLSARHLFLNEAGTLTDAQRFELACIQVRLKQILETQHGEPQAQTP